MLSNEYPSIAERRKLGIYVPYLEVEIAERFGEHVARLFLENFGGAGVFLPKKPLDDHSVSKRIGRDVLEWLIARFGGGTLEVPRGPTSRKTATAVRVRRLIVNTSLSFRDIARLTRNCERTVRRHVSAMRDAGIDLPHRPLESNPTKLNRWDSQRA